MSWSACAIVSTIAALVVLSAAFVQPGAPSLVAAVMWSVAASNMWRVHRRERERELPRAEVRRWR